MNDRNHIPEEELREVFGKGRKEFADEGFTRRVMRQLPQRRSLLPQVIVAVCAVVGIGLTILILGFEPLAGAAQAMAAPLAGMQMPSLVLWLGCLAVAAASTLVGLAICRADTD